METQHSWYVIATRNKGDHWVYSIDSTSLNFAITLHFSLGKFSLEQITTNRFDFSYTMSCRYREQPPPPPRLSPITLST